MRTDPTSKTGASRPRLAPEATDLAARLLAWYDVEHRLLPWRNTRDPYAIWISEIMAQQTRIDTVVPYWNRWMARFPDVGTLAAASEDDVFELWQGLGYYSRARNLRRAAIEIRDAWAGEMPRTTAELKSLPGIGPYTAGAIASIAFDERTPVVDGNVMRVLSRVFLVEDDIRRTPTQRLFWEIAGGLVPGDRPGDFNQSLMELGSEVCTPRSPDCGACPIADLCQGREHADRLPFKSPKTKARAEHRYAFRLVDAADRVLMARNASGALLGGMWQYPMVLAGRDNDVVAAFRTLDSRVAPTEFTELDSVVHVFSHIRMTVTPVLAQTSSAGGARTLEGYDESRWVPAFELPNLAQPRLVKKLAARFAQAQLALI